MAAEAHGPVDSGLTGDVVGQLHEMLRRVVTPTDELLLYILIQLVRLDNKVGSLMVKENQEMAAIDDLNTAVAGLGAEITQFLGDVAGQISGGVTADQAESIVSQINAFTTQLQGADPVAQAQPVASGDAPAPTDGSSTPDAPAQTGPDGQPVQQ